MKKIILLALTIATLFTACKKDNDDNKAGIFKGPEVKVHDGKAWTSIQINKSGNPERLAITLTDAALNSVPVGGGTGDNNNNEEEEWLLSFHPKVSVTPFNHVAMGWNPNGHEPAPIYSNRILIFIFI